MFYLSLGRHIGLNCRLLDWTLRAEVAEYFASCSPLNMNKTGCVWAMEIPDGYFNRTHYEQISPFELPDIINVVKMDYLCDSISELPEPIRRRFSQYGFFTVTKLEDIKTPLEQLDLGEIKISIVEKINSDRKRTYFKQYKDIGEQIFLTNEEKEIIKLNNNFNYGKENDL